MNYISQGKVIKAAVAADVASGGGVVVGDLFGVAPADIAAEATGAVLDSGIVTLPKKSTDTFAAGGKIYWDATEGYVTTTSESNTFAGYYLEADGANAVVRLPL